MDQTTKLYLERADNEIVLSKIILDISDEDELKEQFKVDTIRTFYSGVISHAYYAIFYAAKAYLTSKKIKTEMPHEHNKVYVEFKKFVKKGILAKDLLELYEDVSLKAEVLLKILHEEKRNRRIFTYEQLPQANRKPAIESLENAQRF